MILKRGLNAIRGTMATAAPPSPMMPMPSTVEFSVVMRLPPCEAPDARSIAPAFALCRPASYACATSRPPPARREAAQEANMASIVLGIGSSHGPSIQTDPVGWPRLGDADTRDPRFDYQSLLANAPSDIEAQLTPEKQRERYEAAHAAIGKLRSALDEAKPDVLVVISNPHRVWADETRAVFAVMRAESLPVAERQGFDPDARFRTNEERRAPVINDRPGQPQLAEHLITALNDDGFDVGCGDGVRDGHALDDAFAYAHHYVMPDETLPVVPFMVSRYLPYQASAARCYAMGGALRRAIESWDADARVALMASGGLSHQIIDEELDRGVIAALQSGNAEVLGALERDRLNGAPGTPEILNWVAVAGAMSPGTMTLLDYLPCYRSMAGTGHGLTFGVWG
ncbi:MAG: hypothetical protein F4X54_01405 [Chloroflexi bacterium]|nr:hypothetical protein [Chloroflexota bacterium]MYB83402.1 hypothetical protein [Chloroflexota bacterium]